MKQNDMQTKHNEKLTSHAKDLRKNMTKEERHLWYDFLRVCEHINNEVQNRLV